MSYDAERWARSQKVGNASAKFVLIELASALNRNDSECYPSIDTLEEVTELNRKTVIASTKLLEEKGFIKKRRTFENGKQRIYYSFPMFNPSEWALKQSSKNGTLESTVLEEKGFIKKRRTFENGKQRIYYSFPMFNPSEWALKQSSKNGTLESTENGTLLDQSTKSGTFQSTENGTTESSKNGTLESTVFGPVTRNKNKEKEQGIGTRSVAPSPDHFPDATKKIESSKNGTLESTVFGPVTRNKNKEKEQGIGTRSVAPSPDHFPDATKKIEEPKPKRTTTDRGSRLTITELPDDWKAFAEQEEPDLDPNRKSGRGVPRKSGCNNE